MDFDRSVLEEPDAVLLRPEVEKEVRRILTYFTIPLIFLESGTTSENLDATRYKTNGSGVLVELDGHAFILTAGHCVKLYRTSSCATLVQPNFHTYIISGWPSEYRLNEPGGADFGYIQIPPNHAGRFRAGTRALACLNRLLVGAASEITSRDDWMVMAGYPAALQQEFEEGKGFACLAYTSTLAGSGEAPLSNLGEPKSAVEYVDLWVPKHDNVKPAEDYKQIEMPLLGGASGGGCWTGGVRGEEGQWSEERLRLTGIHVASSGDSAHEHRFAREILIGHHLRLIADTIPALRAFIFRTWPPLEDGRWSAMAS